jgi:NhaA family Na+:H+ antiporter
LALAAWALVHASGIHATVAGVLLGFAVPVIAGGRKGAPAEGLAEHFEHRLRPFSAGFAVPVFAFFSAGVALGGLDGMVAAFRDPVALGVVAALVAGKAVGVFGTTFLVTKTTRASLDSSIAWVDLFGLALLAGIGFTVSLLIGELAFEGDTVLTDEVKAAVLTGSVIAAIAATVLLKIRNAKYRRMVEAEERDDDLDGIPDIYEEDDPAYHLRMAAILEGKAAEHRRLAEQKAAARAGGSAGEGTGPAAGEGGGGGEGEGSRDRRTA